MLNNIKHDTELQVAHELSVKDCVSTHLHHVFLKVHLNSYTDNMAAARGGNRYAHGGQAGRQRNNHRHPEPRPRRGDDGYNVVLENTEGDLVFLDTDSRIILKAKFNPRAGELHGVGTGDIVKLRLEEGNKMSATRVGRPEDFVRREHAVQGCLVIPVRQVEGRWQVLLLQSKNTKAFLDWWFPLRKAATLDPRSPDYRNRHEARAQYLMPCEILPQRLQEMTDGEVEGIANWNFLDENHFKLPRPGSDEHEVLSDYIMQHEYAQQCQQLAQAERVRRDDGGESRALTIWNFPGGRPEQGETEIQTAWREAREELGSGLQDRRDLPRPSHLFRFVVFDTRQDPNAVPPQAEIPRALAKSLDLYTMECFVSRMSNRQQDHIREYRDTSEFTSKEFKQAVWLDLQDHLIAGLDGAHGRVEQLRSPKDMTADDTRRFFRELSAFLDKGGIE